MTPPEKPPRQGTIHGDRNEDRRVVTPARGVPIDEFTTDRPITNVDLEPLDEVIARQKRAERMTHSGTITVTTRLDAQDLKIAQIDDKVDGITSKVDRIGGQMEVFPRLVTALERAADAGQERQTLTVKAELQTQHMHTTDKLEKKRWWRTQAAKIIGAAVGGGTVLELMHKVFG